jgi:hypothetical protein
VSADAAIWFLSLPACVDNLVHAAHILSERRGHDASFIGASLRTHASLPKTRAITLPALRATVAQIIDALARRHGEAIRELVHFEPDASMQEQFGCWPPLETPAANRIGFRHDGNLDVLIERSLQTV